MTPEIMLSNKKYFNFIEADVSNVTLETVANALSKICRFTGNCDKMYSVAQHSVLASYIVVEGHEWDALWHDASESLLGDVSSPLKQLLPEYKVIEEKVEKALAKKFDLQYPMPVSVKVADMSMLKSEFIDILGCTPEEIPSCCELYAGYGKNIKPWSHKRARLEFIFRAFELKGYYDGLPLIKIYDRLKCKIADYI